MKQILSLLCIVAMCAMITVSCSDENDETTKTFTVTFDSQGGSSVSAQTIAEGEKVTEPASPTKEGVVFGGWYTSTDYAKAWDFSKNVVTENITLYAKWASESVTVNFNTNGGNEIAEQKVAKGGLLANLPIPVKAGSAFDSWYINKELTTKFDASTPIEKDMTLYAKWTTISKESLLKLIEQAQKLNGNNYTDESYEKMHKKLQAADEIVRKENATEEEIETAYQNLSQAINSLVAVVVRPTVALSIFPQPIEGIIYINPINGFFQIYANGVDAIGDYSTNDKVVFEYDNNKLEAWAMDRTEEGDEEKLIKAIITCLSSQNQI